MADFKDTLKKAVRQMAFRTSVDKLKKKGVSSVNVLGIDRIISLIEAAVHRSLKSRLVGIERDAVAKSTKTEFLRLLRSNNDLKRAKSKVEQERERAEEEIDQMRRELGDKRSQLEVKLDEDAVEMATRYDGKNTEIVNKVAAVVTSLVESGDDVEVDGDERVAVQGRLMELVMDVVSGERRQAETARKALHDREIQTLQRRITKLGNTLNETETRLTKITAIKSVDTGISSIYREVQGVDKCEDHSDKKKELMANLFKANLMLQKRGKGA